MNVLIAGGSGLIGRQLTKSLLKDNHKVWILSRDPYVGKITPGVSAVRWDGVSTKGWGHLINEMNAVVNLTGWSLAHWPWTKENKKRFLASRLQPASAITQAIRNASICPEVLIQASAIGYYGPQENPVTEDSPVGEDFGAKLCEQWEIITKPVEEMGVRRVVIRSAVVLSTENIILQLMVLPSRIYFGGKLGSGCQGFSWIHIIDEVAAIRFLLENKRAIGIFNISAPEPLTIYDFLRTTAKVLRRPFWFPIPPFVLRLILGEMSTLILDGQFVHPKRLLELGFIFTFIEAEQALKNLLSKNI